METTIKVTNVKRAMQQLNKLGKEMELPFIEIIKGGAQLIRGEAIRSIHNDPKTGRVYEMYNPRRTHTASAPGESPASDTGNLVRNIKVKQKSKNVIAVESTADYSAFLEYGTSKMQARPFLFPAFEKSKPKITKVVFERTVRKIKELVR